MTMAALSAIAAYDVSDVESDEEGDRKEKSDVIEQEENSMEKQSPFSVDVSDADDDQIKSDSDEVVEPEAMDVPSDQGAVSDESVKDEDDSSMIISEDEKEIQEIPTITQPVKLKFKRYSCDSATALAVKLKGMTEEELHLPPEPEGRCSKQLQDKIKKLYEKRLKEGENLNKAIQARKDFRNPSIYDKLILYLGIEERGTNFAKADFNPSSWRKVPDYEALARAQREDVAKRERQKKTKVEFVTGTVKKSSSAISSDNAKKSKWDNPGDDKASSSKGVPSKTADQVH